MSYIDPIAKVLIDDPRVDGYVNKEGIGIDLPFADPVDTPAVSQRGLTGAPHLVDVAAWDFTGTMYVPELDAVIIRPDTEWLDASATDWQIGPLVDSRIVRPWGEYADSLEIATNGADVQWISTFTWDSDRGCEVSILTYPPTSDLGERRLYVAFGQDRADGHTWTFTWDSKNLEILAGYPAFTIGTRRFNNTAWLHTMRAFGREARMWRFRFLPVDEYIVIMLEGVDHPLVARMSGAGEVIPQGTVRVQLDGINRGAINWSGLTYATYSWGHTARLRDYIRVDGLRYVQPTAANFCRYEPPGTDITYSDAGYTGAILPTLTLKTTDPKRTPVLYRAQIYSDASFTTPTDLDTQQEVTDEVYSFTIRLNELRGHTCELRFTDEDLAWNVHRLAKVTLSGNWDEGGGETADQPLGVYYAISPVIELNPDDYSGVRLWAVRCASIDYLLDRSIMGRDLSYGGWTLANAFARIVKNGGIPTSIISTPGSTPTLPGWRDEGRFHYGRGEKRAAVLDDLVRATAYEWGVKFSPSHQVFLRLPLSYSTYDATLDGDDATFENSVATIRRVRDVENLVNFVEIVGRDDTGRSVVRYARDKDSVTDKTNARFCGHWLQESLPVPDTEDGSAAVQRLFQRARERSDIIEWTWQYHPTLFPGHFVRCLNLNTSRLRITDGSIYRIISKTIEGRQGPEGNTMRETCVGVFVQ